MKDGNINDEITTGKIIKRISRVFQRLVLLYCASYTRKTAGYKYYKFYDAIKEETIEKVLQLEERGRENTEDEPVTRNMPIL